MVKMGKNRSYWNIEFLTKKGYSVPCFSPKFYGSFLKCKIWITKQDFLSTYTKDKSLTQKITLQYETIK